MKKIQAIIMAALFCVLLTNTVSASFVSSIEAKPAPTLATQTDEDGNEYVAAIVDSDGNVLATVGADAIAVTPVSDSSSLDAATQEQLDNAYTQISDASDLSEIAPEITDVVDSLGLSVENLAVQDLFDITVSDEVRALLDEGHAITFAFSATTTSGQALIVLHNYEGDSWEVIDPSLVDVQDGVVYVSFTSLSPIAFVVDASDSSYTDDTTDSTTTQTGDSYNYIVLVTLIASVAVLIVLISKKYLSAKN